MEQLLTVNESTFKTIIWRKFSFDKLSFDQQRRKQASS